MVQRGNHAQLMGVPGLYRQLWIEQSQFTDLDPNTGTWNQRYTLYLLERHVQRSRRYGVPLSLMLLERKDTGVAGIDNSSIRNLVIFLKRRLRETDEIGTLSDGRLLVMMPHTVLVDARSLQKSLATQLVDFLANQKEHSAWLAFSIVSWQASYTATDLLCELSHDLRPLLSLEGQT